MFENYNNLDPNYIPNNQVKFFPSVEIHFPTDPPRKEYNIKGELVGLSWYYGDTLTIRYSTDKTIYVEDDALIYETTTSGPDENTYGRVGQKAYNTIDMKCWVCIEADYNNNIFTWELRPFYYSHGGKEIVVSTQDMTNKKIVCKIKNWRGEAIYTTSIEHSNYINVYINEDIPFKAGIYTIAFYIVGEDYQLLDEEYKLIIK